MVWLLIIYTQHEKPNNFFEGELYPQNFWYMKHGLLNRSFGPSKPHSNDSGTIWYGDMKTFEAIDYSMAIVIVHALMDFPINYF